MKITAKNMVPGATYMATLDGPMGMTGLAFTVVATVSFDPERGSVPNDDTALVQVVYDAWAWPFPQSCVFAPHDIVITVNNADMSDEDEPVMHDGDPCIHPGVFATSEDPDGGEYCPSCNARVPNYDL